MCEESESREVRGGASSQGRKGRVEAPISIRTSFFFLLISGGAHPCTLPSPNILRQGGKENRDCGSGEWTREGESGDWGMGCVRGCRSGRVQNGIELVGQREG